MKRQKSGSFIPFRAVSSNIYKIKERPVIPLPAFIRVFSDKEPAWPHPKWPAPMIKRKKTPKKFCGFTAGVTKSGTSLLKKSVHDLLLLAHKFLAFFQSIRFALDVDYSAMMQNPVQDGGGDGDIGKYLVPLGEGLVRGKHGGGFLIPSGKELKEQICALNIHGKITDFVNDPHPVLG